MNTTSLWTRFQDHYLRYDELGFSLDISRMRFADDFFSKMDSKVKKAFEEMAALEKGALANPDEKRMVGHYWLRAPQLAPTAELKKTIEETNASILKFSKEIHDGKILTPGGKSFKVVVIIGIGGSALGPQFMADALGTTQDKMAVSYFDNTDPEGMDRVIDRIGDQLSQTLVVVISKSGGTKETRNGMLEAKARFEKAGLPFAKHAVAVTGDGSELDLYSKGEGWLARFPMWDWVGGRTSVMSAVGLLPMALQGLDVTGFLKGASAMDQRTRVADRSKNAAMQVALMWYFAGNGKGEKDMVVLPYKDRLVLFSKYLQQLVMESLGKEKDLDGKVVNQGIAVYGNKGSTDQHAYVQQLRDGVLNFFVTFIEVRKDRSHPSMEVEPGVVTGDYLQGFLRGTRTALYEGGRDSITLSIPAVNAFYVGALIALYDRAVGFYASLVNINAYHQPGVEAGKKAATRILELQAKVKQQLKSEPGKALTAPEIAAKIGADAEDVYHLLVHLFSNSGLLHCQHAERPEQERYSWK